MIIPITILPPTTKSPKAEIISLTSAGPLCPSLKIDLVVAIFKDNLNKANIKISVGKVDKSDGFTIYKDISKINKDNVNDIIKKKSKNIFGKGTMIMAKIDTKSATITKSFEKILLRFIL
jgi:hypothetical protein